MLTGISHVTIAVSDLERSLKFYTSVLGLEAKVKWATGAYLSAGDLWVCLSQGSTHAAEDYSHIAFAITESDFDSFAEQLDKLGVSKWQDNSSEGRSVYILDPDGHKLEIHVGNLQTRLEALQSKPYDGLVWF
ncbi:MAG: fosfomycin resistance glutathione transferase [Pseudomonadota bacterium]